MSDPILAKRDKNPGGSRGRMVGKKEEKESERAAAGDASSAISTFWLKSQLDVETSSKELLSPLASNGEPRYWPVGIILRS